MKGYIYIITNVITGKQYIGQTIKTIQERFCGHKSTARNKTDSTYLHNSMRKYGEENFKIEQVVSIEYDNQQDLCSKLNELEKLYIAKFNTLVPNGYNMTKGGTEGAEYLKKKIDEYDLNFNFIQTHDSLIDAVRKYGYPNSSPIRSCCAGEDKFAYKKIWRYHGDSIDKYELPNPRIANRENKMASVDQYLKDGTLIASYCSISEACRCMGINTSTSHISECCEGKIRLVYGYIWRYKGDSFDKYCVSDKRTSACRKYDLSGNYLETYSSINEACLSIEKDPRVASGNIVMCCKGKKKTAYGYKWKYVQ